MDWLVHKEFKTQHYSIIEVDEVVHFFLVDTIDGNIFASHLSSDSNGAIEIGEFHKDVNTAKNAVATYWAEFIRDNLPF